MFQGLLNALPYIFMGAGIMAAALMTLGIAYVFFCKDKNETED